MLDVGKLSRMTRSFLLQYVSDSTAVNKEVANHSSGPHREDHQRREREILIERKRKETTEVKDKKLVREAVVAALSSNRGNPGSPRVDSNKDRTTILTKDSAETSGGEQCIVDSVCLKLSCYFPFSECQNMPWQGTTSVIATVMEVWSMYD